MTVIHGWRFVIGEYVDETFTIGVAWRQWVEV